MADQDQVMAEVNRVFAEVFNEAKQTTSKFLGKKPEPLPKPKPARQGRPARTYRGARRNAARARRWQHAQGTASHTINWPIGFHRWRRRRKSAAH